MICTKPRLTEKIKRIKKILLDNGYPKNVVNALIAKKIAQFPALKRFGPEMCPVYLGVAWIGKPFANMEYEIITSVKSCVNASATGIIGK